MIKWIMAIMLLSIPVIVMAATIPPPPVELFQVLPLTSAWMFGIILLAFLGAVAIIAKLVHNSIKNAIDFSTREIKILKTEVKALHDAWLVMATEHGLNHGKDIVPTIPRRDGDPTYRVIDSHE